MWLDQVSNPAPLAHVSDALQTALCGPATPASSETTEKENLFCIWPSILTKTSVD